MEVVSESVKNTIIIIADKIRKLRNEKGISAREMSLELGQNVNYINLIENGKRKPSLEMFLSICEYLNTTPSNFFKNLENNNTIPSDEAYNSVVENLLPHQKKSLEDFIKSIQIK